VLLVALWAVAPAAFVLSMVYTEALFCALAVWALVAVADRRWITAGVLTMLAGTVHSSGAILVAAVAVAALAAVIESARAGRLTPGAWLRPAAAVVISPLGLIGFWLFVQFGLGYPGGWLAAEAASGQHVKLGVGTSRAVIATLSAPNAFDLLSVLAIVAGAGLAAWTLTERMPGYLKVYVVCTVLLAVLTGPGWLGSKPRILLPALLLGLPLAKILAPSRNYVLIPLIAVLAAASAWFTLIQATVGIAPRTGLPRVAARRSEPGPRFPVRASGGLPGDVQVRLKEQDEVISSPLRPPRCVLPNSNLCRYQAGMLALCAGRPVQFR
jgi:hypothetical protein